jgi:hypothetical protein
MKYMKRLVQFSITTLGPSRYWEHEKSSKLRGVGAGYEGLDISGVPLRDARSFPARPSRVTRLHPVGLPLCIEWPRLIRAVQGSRL